MYPPVDEAFNRPAMGKDTHTTCKDNATKLKDPDVFADQGDIRFGILMTISKQLSCAAEPALDLVENQGGPVTAADL